MSDLRKQRFTDTTFASDPRPYNQSNPFANRAIPSDFKKIQELLATERGASKLYNEVWKDAEYAFQSKKERLPPEYFKPTTKDECYIAVIAYTLDDEIVVGGKKLQLYRDFNQQFRALSDEASWDRFPYKSFYYLMTLALPGVKNKPAIDRALYRGIKNIHISPDPKVGDHFYFDYFASCSIDRAVAERFMGKNGTMVVVKNGITVGCGIAAYSLYDEDEVLAYPKNQFRITKFEKKGTEDLLEVEHV